MTIHYILVVVALILAILAAINVPSRFSLLAAAIAFFFLSLLVTGCAGRFHGNVHAGVAGSVTDPTNAQFNVGAQTDFAKRHNSSGK